MWTPKSELLIFFRGESFEIRNASELNPWIYYVVILKIWINCSLFLAGNWNFENSKFKYKHFGEPRFWMLLGPSTPYFGKWVIIKKLGHKVQPNKKTNTENSNMDQLGIITRLKIWKKSKIKMWPRLNKRENKGRKKGKREIKVQEKRENKSPKKKGK